MSEDIPKDLEKSINVLTQLLAECFNLIETLAGDAAEHIAAAEQLSSIVANPLSHHIVPYQTSLLVHAARELAELRNSTIANVISKWRQEVATQLDFTECFLKDADGS